MNRLQHTLSEVKRLTNEVCTIGGHFLKTEAKYYIRSHKECVSVICAMGSLYAIIRNEDSDEYLNFTDIEGNDIGVFLDQWDGMYHFTGLAWRFDKQSNGDITYNENW